MTRQIIFLIESHIDEKKVQLRPDMVLEKEAQRKIIIDTKWKLIDETKFKGNYKISLPDLYQLYAYGKKVCL
jgi:5-methylcytosine-specific restriction enzyme subunit McrC